MAKKKVTKKSTKKVTKKVTKKAAKRSTKTMENRRDWTTDEGDLVFDQFNKVYEKAGFKLVERAEADAKDSNTPIGGIEYAVYTHPNFKKYSVHPKLDTVLVIEFHVTNLTSHRQSLGLKFSGKSDFWFYLSSDFQNLIRKRSINQDNILNGVANLLEGISSFTKLASAYKKKKVTPKHFSELGRAAIWNKVKIHPKLKSVSWEDTDETQFSEESIVWGHDPKSNYLNMLATLACNIFDKKYATQLNYVFVDKTSGELKNTYTFPNMAHKVALTLRKNIAQLVQDYFENGKSDLYPKDNEGVVSKEKKTTVKKTGQFLNF